jgi:fructose-1,6-bisphosphatase/inositol monophosphatase family enzyme
MPALREVFSGARGIGAMVNGSPIRCRAVPSLDEARIFINEANLMLVREPERMARLMTAGRLRRFANDCYAFGLLAMGQIDAVVDMDLKPYDYLPIVPVVEGAGGVITDWAGKALGLHSGGTVLAAGTPALHAAMLDLLR